ncbi:MAG: hypothetical protein P4L92_22905 [Rudaea sp.]|nr:hypothetical protein [Rudaea sp.]
MNQSIQSNTPASTIGAAEAALMRWNPSMTLAAIQALRDARPGWPVVSAPAQQVAA